MFYQVGNWFGSFDGSGIKKMNNEFITLLISNAHHAHGLNLENMILSAVIHGLTYEVIYKVFHDVSPLTASVIAAAVIGALWLVFGKRR